MKMSAFYLHSGPEPPQEKEPFTVVQGTFHLELYDINSLLCLPLTNLRKIWKIMFSAAWENEQTIKQVRDWLPRAAASTKESIQLAEDALKSAKATAAREHSRCAVMGDGYWERQVVKLKRQQKAVAKGAYSTITSSEIDRRLNAAIAQRDAPKVADRAVKDAQNRLAHCKAKQEKIAKLHTIFNDMAAQAKI